MREEGVIRFILFFEPDLPTTRPEQSTRKRKVSGPTFLSARSETILLHRVQYVIAWVEVAEYLLAGHPIQYVLEVTGVYLFCLDTEEEQQQHPDNASG